MRELQLGIMFSIANANKSRVALSAQDVTHENFNQKVCLPRLYLKLSSCYLAAVHSEHSAGTQPVAILNKAGLATLKATAE